MAFASDKTGEHPGARGKRHDRACRRDLGRHPQPMLAASAHLQRATTAGLSGHVPCSFGPLPVANPMHQRAAALNSAGAHSE